MKSRHISTPVIVLGNHRSGTSLVAHLLIRLNVNMGDQLLGPDENNPGGYFEDLEFLELNKRILYRAGGSWRHEVSKTDMLRGAKMIEKEIPALLDKRKFLPRWGWKDPRTTLTLPAYIPFLEDARIIICQRKPKAIAKSLSRAHGGPAAEWIPLIRHYNRALSDIRGEAPFAFTVVQFEDLLNPDRQFNEVRKIAFLINGKTDHGTLEHALQIVRTPNKTVKL